MGFLYRSLCELYWTCSGSGLVAYVGTVRRFSGGKAKATKLGGTGSWEGGKGAVKKI